MNASFTGVGRFVTLEGGEGAGKSTQLGLLGPWLAAHGVDAVLTREPGGGPAAEAIRTLLVAGAPDRWDGVAEALLVAAARRSHVTGIIAPALAAGRWVVSDRFADSTIAYQGYGRGVDLADLATLRRLACGALSPDLTVMLDLPVAVGLARAAARPGFETRFERVGRDFHERLRTGFLAIAAAEPARCVVLDATASIEAVQHDLRGAIADRLGPLHE